LAALEATSAVIAAVRNRVSSLPSSTAIGVLLFRSNKTIAKLNCPPTVG
jgi:hypothetical protein